MAGWFLYAFDQTQASPDSQLNSAPPDSTLKTVKALASKRFGFAYIIRPRQMAMVPVAQKPEVQKALSQWAEGFQKSVEFPMLIEAKHVESIAALFGDFRDPRVPDFVTVFRFSNAELAGQIVNFCLTERDFRRCRQGQHDYYAPVEAGAAEPDDSEAAVSLLDNKTLLFGPVRPIRDSLRQLNQAPPLVTTNTLAGVLKDADPSADFALYGSLDAIREPLASFKEMIARSPMAGLAPVLDDISQVSLVANLAPQPRMRATARLGKLEGREKVQEVAEGMLNAARILWPATKAQMLEGVQGSWQPLVKQTARLIDAALPAFTIESKGREVTATLVNGITSDHVADFVLSIGQTAQNTRLDQIDRKHMREVAEVWRTAEQDDGELPEDITDPKTGEKLLSWRVKLLPSLGHQDLYNQFKLDQPWNSPHNKKLLAKMPEVFLAARSGHKLTQGKTNFLIPVGKGFLYGPEKTMTVKQVNAGDRMQHTAVLLEADDSVAVPWTQPADLMVDPEKPLAGLGGLRPYGFFVGLGDGDVRFAPSDINGNTLLQLLRPTDGQGRSWDALRWSP